MEDGRKNAGWIKGKKTPCVRQIKIIVYKILYYLIQKNQQCSNIWFQLCSTITSYEISKTKKAFPIFHKFLANHKTLFQASVSTVTKFVSYLWKINNFSYYFINLLRFHLCVRKNSNLRHFSTDREVNCLQCF